MLIQLIWQLITGYYLIKHRMEMKMAEKCGWPEGGFNAVWSLLAETERFFTEGRAQGDGLRPATSGTIIGRKAPRIRTSL